MESTAMKSKERYEYIDFYKGLAILLIMTHHVLQYFEPCNVIVSYITDFHVAMFYIASGVLAWLTFSKESSFMDFLMKKVKRLLIPYLFFAAFGAALKLGVMLITGALTIGDITDEMYQIVTIGNGPIWYLYRFFMIEMFYWWYKKTVLKKANRITEVLIYVVCIVLLTVLQPFEGYIIFTVRSLLAGFIYLMIGFYVGKYLLHRIGEETNDSNSPVLVGGGTLLFLLGSVLSCLLDVSLGLKTGGYENLFIGMLVSASISIGLMILLRYFIRYENKLVNVIKYYGRNSLIVLCVHPTLLLMFSYPFSSKVAELSTSIQVITAIVVLSVIVVAEIPFINVLTKRFPVLVGIEKDRKQSS